MPQARGLSMVRSAFVPRARLAAALLVGLAGAVFAVPDAEAQGLFGGRAKGGEDYLALIERGAFSEAATHADGQLGRRAARRERRGEVDGRSLLHYVHAASAFMWAGDHEQAISRFESTDEAIKQYEIRLGAATGAEAVGSTLFGNQVRAYRPKASDGVLVNTYKALNFMALGGMDDARLELHRADERTRRAVEMFAKEIEVEKAGNDEAPEVGTGQVSSLISEHYPGIDQWQVYDDFVNPFSVYLHAIYFFAAHQGPSDIEHAVTSIQRVAGMHPGNTVLEADLLMMDQVASGQLARADIPDSVWVICEDGMGPAVDSKEIDFAMPVSGRVVPMRLALPELRLNAASSGGCSVQVGEQRYEAQEVASMDRVVQSEFRKRLPGEITRSISGMLVRGAIQNEAQRQNEGLGAIAGMLYQNATATTETRVWEGLPKSWYAVRIPRPADGALRVLGTDGRLLGDSVMPEGQLSLLVVRNPSRDAPASLSSAVLSAN